MPAGRWRLQNQTQAQAAVTLSTLPSMSFSQATRFPPGRVQMLDWSWGM